MSAASLPADIARLSYEEARTELVEVVRQLESGQVPLAETMTLWERGEALATHCRQWLAQAQARLDAAAPLAGDEEE